MKITTKGFDYYRSKKQGKEWFDIFEILSERELLEMITKCVEEKE